MVTELASYLNCNRMIDPVAGASTASVDVLVNVGAETVPVGVYAPAVQMGAATVPVSVAGVPVKIGGVSPLFVPAGVYEFIVSAGAELVPVSADAAPVKVGAEIVPDTVAPTN